MDDKDPHIHSQNSAHRRGLVLGLTMAEIMVLILFTLLLALAAALGAKNNAIRDKDQRLAALSAFERQMNELLRNSPPGTVVTDIIQRLERQQDQIAALQKEVNRLRPYEAGGKALEDIVHAIRRGSGESPTPQQIVEKIRQAGQIAKDNENLRGQLTQLSNQIKAAGRGNEFPSCWVTLEGKAESIFELWVTANGIVVKDHDLPRRATDKAELPLSDVRYGAEIERGEFLRQLRPLYQWSAAHQCRFYVIRYTSVPNAPYELLNAMDAYFYPDSRILYRPGGL